MGFQKRKRLTSVRFPFAAIHTFFPLLNLEKEAFLWGNGGNGEFENNNRGRTLCVQKEKEIHLGIWKNKKLKTRRTNTQKSLIKNRSLPRLDRTKAVAFDGITKEKEAWQQHDDFRFKDLLLLLLPFSRIHNSGGAKILTDVACLIFGKEGGGVYFLPLPSLERWLRRRGRGIKSA